MVKSTSFPSQAPITRNLPGEQDLTLHFKPLWDNSNPEKKTLTDMGCLSRKEVITFWMELAISLKSDYSRQHLKPKMQTITLSLGADRSFLVYWPFPLSGIADIDGIHSLYPVFRPVGPKDFSTVFPEGSVIINESTAFDPIIFIY